MKSMPEGLDDAPVTDSQDSNDHGIWLEDV